MHQAVGPTLDYSGPVTDTKGQATVFEVTHTGAIENVKKRSEEQSHVLSVLFNMGTTETAGNKLATMGLTFPYPKPVKLIEYLLGICPKKDAVVLDFFAGSSTTLEAVAQMNAVDGGSRSCILVTNNENGICREVTQPRIKQLLSGRWKDGAHTPLPGSLRFYETSFVQRRRSVDRMRSDIAAHATSLIAVKEATTKATKVGNGVVLLHGAGKTVAVAATFDTDHAKACAKANTKVRDGDDRIAYLFTWSDQGIEPEIAAKWPDWKVQPLPAEMLAELRNVAPERGLFDEEVVS